MILHFEPQQMMWALEYNPELFSLYEGGDETNSKSDTVRLKRKAIRQYGKYERANRKNQARVKPGSVSPLPISVFLVASVLKDRSDKLLTEARGLDDVVKVNPLTLFRELKPKIKKKKKGLLFYVMWFS